MHIHDAFLPRMIQMLVNLDRWIDEAEATGTDMDALLTSRLAPDMFTLTRQIQSACDTAKFATARLAGREAPKHADDEKTLADVRARIATVLEYVRGFSPEDFDGGEDRLVGAGWMPPGKKMRGADYLTEYAMPNFFFHVVTAYDLMRHAGVPLGKIKFIGAVTLVDG